VSTEVDHGLSMRGLGVQRVSDDDDLAVDGDHQRPPAIRDRRHHET